MVKVPKGESFLPNYSSEELTELYHKEEDSKAKVRLLAARLLNRVLLERQFTII
jgi:hypothetical protein